MTVSNPEAFCAQFRDELIADLQLRASICCPKCVITYIGGAHTGDQCYYGYPDDFSQPGSDDEYESTVEMNLELQCVFDYEDTEMEGEMGGEVRCCLRMPRIELGSPEPQSGVLPLNYILSSKDYDNPWNRGWVVFDLCGARTHDLPIRSRVLFQLS